VREGRKRKRTSSLSFPLVFLTFFTSFVAAYGATSNQKVSETGKIGVSSLTRTL
jgi:hypothetical protein